MNTRIKEFQRSVENKFNVYNSLFLSLPFREIRNTGVLIPLLQNECREGLMAHRQPAEIMDSFFAARPEIKTERDRINFMFRVIQYVERQVVLFDSVEDAAFPQLRDVDEQLSLRSYIQHATGRYAEKPAADIASTDPEKNNVYENLSTFATRIVFTAHPTQFYPQSVLKIIAQLRNLISQNEISGIDRKLQQLGLTSLLKSTRPTPLEEAKNIIYFLRYVYYDAVGEMYADIKRATEGADFDNTRIIQLGFWPGGDRDGNPFVTSKTTTDVANELRMTLMKCYYKDLKDLESKLTFRKVEDNISRLIASVYEAMFDATSVLTFEQLLDPLVEVKQDLISDYNGLYLEDIDLMIDKVRIFKMHFATIDVRQNHRVHARIVEQILIRNSVISSDLQELEQDELVRILLDSSFQIQVDDYDDELIRDTIHTIRGIRGIQEKNGEEGCNRYVISNSEDIFSVLFVFALFRWCWNQEDFPIDIIPLFESVDGMEVAGSIMETLYNFPSYRAHLNRRENTQTMMLGFSDGTKDGGYLQANWSIHKTKERLSSVSEEAGIRAIFFDGRGGPPARGGGKTHRFYASQSGNIANHAIELTIQGQVITSMYGTREHFKFQCEQLIAAGIHNNMRENANHISESSRVLFDELATLSYKKYTDLKNHPKFIPYLEKKSTLRYYNRTNVGSRPAMREAQNTLVLENLRAIPFVGAWSQLKQNVPGYFGIGTAFKAVADDGRLENIRELFRDVPFFKTLILNSMMSLSKCNFALTEYLGDDPEFGPFWNVLLSEYELSREMVLLVSGYTKLMEEEPISRRSIAIREEIVTPLLVIQQYALQKLESDTKKRAVYEKIVTRSLYGNINASRNSA